MWPRVARWRPDGVGVGPSLSHATGKEKTTSCQCSVTDQRSSHSQQPPSLNFNSTFAKKFEWTHLCLVSACIQTWRQQTFRMCVGGRDTRLPTSRSLWKQHHTVLLIYPRTATLVHPLSISASDKKTSTRIRAKWKKSVRHILLWWPESYFFRRTLFTSPVPNLSWWSELSLSQSRRARQNLFFLLHNFVVAAHFSV